MVCSKRIIHSFEAKTEIYQESEIAAANSDPRNACVPELAPGQTF
jgi:hypothetical protein